LTAAIPLRTSWQSMTKVFGLFLAESVAA
jgi:hypothetical protein